jgi:outer membrane receptor protein involved in Fe transport
MLNNMIVHCAGLLPLAIACLAAHAQDMAGEPVTPQVEVKATYDTRRDDTATRIVVTQDELLQYGDTSLGDALKRLQGVTIGDVQGQGGNIRLRGLGSGHTQILLNGEPSPPGFSLDTLAPDMIERVEIMRAATAEYTTQAIAGTINIVLKRAVHVAQRDVKLGVRADNHQPGTTTNFQFADRTASLSYALGGGLNWGTQDRPTTGLTTFTMPDGAETTRRIVATANPGTYASVNLAPRMNFTLSAGDTITSQSFLHAVRYHGASDERTTTLFGTLPQFSRSDNVVENANATVRTDVTWTHKIDGRAVLDAKAGVNYSHRDNTIDARNFYEGDVFALTEDVRATARERGVTFSGKYATQLFDGHALAAGWDSAWSRRGEARRQRDHAPIGAPTADLDQAYDANVARIAFFVQDEWTIAAQWSGYIGVRWEGSHTHSAGAGYAQVENTLGVLSPLFQTLYKLTSVDQVRLGITRTYKAPTLAQLIPRRISATNNTATSPDEQGNPHLLPELAWGLDLAYEHTIPGGGLLSASTYARRIDNNQSPQTVLIDDRWVATPVNTGKAQVHGIELEAKFPLCRLFAAARAIEVRANIARNWSRNDRAPYDRLASQTPVSANLGLDYKTTRLALGASYHFQNGGPVHYSANEFDYTGPQRVLDLYAMIQVTAGIGLRLSIGNALHQQHVSAVTYVDGAGAQSDAVFTPTATVFRATLEMKL